MGSLLLLLAIHTAQAGKLEEGFKGLPWGITVPFPAPSENCVNKPEAAVEWTCQQTIGEIPVTSSYMYKYELLSAVIVRSKGFVGCSTLMDILTAAYGESRPVRDFMKGKMDDRYWSSSKVWASWKWNKYSDECTLFMMHNQSQDEIKKRDKAEAEKAKNDL